MKTSAVLGLLTFALAGQCVAQTVDSVVTNLLAEPYGVAAAPNDVGTSDYYLTDSAHHRIVKFVPDTDNFSTFAGFSDRPGQDDRKGLLARFNNPRGIVWVPQRNGFVVADYANHTLRFVAKSDATVSTLAGIPGNPGPAVLPPAGGAPGAGLSSQFNFPSALAVDSVGNVYIADSKNHAVRKLDLSNLVSTVVAGLNEPSGLALDSEGNLWIADSRDHTIKMLAVNSSTPVLVAGVPGQSGAVDSLFAAETQFNKPTGLLWDPNLGLLVCDTGNHAIRRVYVEVPEIGYSVATYVGVLGQPGYLDGPGKQAKFNGMTALATDPGVGILVADLGNDAIRRIQQSAQQPAVRNPVIGYVIYVQDQFGQTVSKLIPSDGKTFFNDQKFAILAENGTTTYYNAGKTGSRIDTPPLNSLTAPADPGYTDGLPAGSFVPEINLSTNRPSVTVYAISTQKRRRPSALVVSQFDFKVATPSIVGDNPASFKVNCSTDKADIRYTVGYTSDPTPPPPPTRNSERVANGTVRLPRSDSDIIFQVQAYREGFADSTVLKYIFSKDNYHANQIAFGFDNGDQASSAFQASPGQTFYAPVTLEPLPEETIYSLQFNLSVAPQPASPPVTGNVAFQSMLLEKLDALSDLYRTIPPALYFGTNAIPSPAIYPGSAASLGYLQIRNPADNLIGVGWLERFPSTFLYNTLLQDLISFSSPHDDLYFSSDENVVVGAYGFNVPAGAQSGNVYQIRIGRPSATSDGIGTDTLIETPTTGAIGAANNESINAVKNVTISSTSPRYVVGDCAPFRWYNAGEFGDSFLLNNDVLQTFQSAIYRYSNNTYSKHWPKTPTMPDSDLFSAMDSSDGSNSNVYDGGDTGIDSIQFGDGEINVDDIYVTFRRSIDPNRKWFARYWENGTLKAVEVPNAFPPGRGSSDQPAEQFSISSADAASQTVIAGEPGVAFTIDDFEVTPGQSLQIPVKARVTGNYPMRVLMMGVSVEGLDGSPDLSTAVRFVPSGSLGDPSLTSSLAANSFGGAWLNSQAPGLIGESVVGTLSLSVPANATSNSVYRVHFNHASGSPNGLALLPKKTQDGLLMLKSRSQSSLSDGLPDTWRLRYFGSVSNLLAQADADADGDGASNMAEFKTGTNPVDPRSYFGVAARASSPDRPLVLRWPSMLNKTYVIEAASSVTSSEWTTLGAGLKGTGTEMQFTPAPANGTVQFYRVRLAE